MNNNVVGIAEALIFMLIHKNHYILKAKIDSYTYNLYCHQCDTDIVLRSNNPEVIKILEELQ